MTRNSTVFELSFRSINGCSLGMRVIAFFSRSTCRKGAISFKNVPAIDTEKHTIARERRALERRPRLEPDVQNRERWTLLALFNWALCGAWSPRRSNQPVATHASMNYRAAIAGRRGDLRHSHHWTKQSHGSKESTHKIPPSFPLTPSYTPNASTATQMRWLTGSDRIVAHSSVTSQ